MGAPLTYRRECGPVALAAVTELDLPEAADLLWTTRRGWGGDGATSGPGGLSFGTPPHAVGDALVRLGWGVELWRGQDGGRLVADRTMYPSLLARLAHGRVTTADADPDAGDGDRDRGRGPGRDGLEPLSSWRSRMGAGYWLYTVLPAGDGQDAHLVACWGPEVLAGDNDGRYDEAPVWEALRALPPGT